jgi:hypothetical protein
MASLAVPLNLSSLSRLRVLYQTIVTVGKVKFDAAVETAGRHWEMRLSALRAFHEGTHDMEDHREKQWLKRKTGTRQVRR